MDVTSSRGFAVQRGGQLQASTGFQVVAGLDFRLIKKDYSDNGQRKKNRSWQQIRKKPKPGSFSHWC